MEVGRALATSTDKADRDLARSIATFIQEMPSSQVHAVPARAPEIEQASRTVDLDTRR